MLVRDHYVGDATAQCSTRPSCPAGGWHIRTLYNQHLSVLLVVQATGSSSPHSDRCCSGPFHTVADLIVFCRGFGAYPDGAVLYWNRFFQLQVDRWSVVFVE